MFTDICWTERLWIPSGKSVWDVTYVIQCSCHARSFVCPSSMAYSIWNDKHSDAIGPQQESVIPKHVTWVMSLGHHSGKSFISKSIHGQILQNIKAVEDIQLDVKTCYHTIQWLSFKSSALGRTFYRTVPERRTFPGAQCTRTVTMTRRFRDVGGAWRADRDEQDERDVTDPTVVRRARMSTGCVFVLWRHSTTPSGHLQYLVRKLRHENTQYNEIV